MNAVSRKVAIRSHTELRGARPAQSFEGRREQRTKRLSEWEAEDLRYLWQGYEADLGVKSAHGMIERHILLMAPPRDVQRPVLEELARAGGLAPEGRIVRLVVLDGLATRCEVKRAIEYLSRAGKKGPRIERIPVPQPEIAGNRKTWTLAEEHRFDEWTGYDLRLTPRGEVRMGLALSSVPVAADERVRRRWAAADESLRLEWETMDCKKPHGGAKPNDEFLGVRERRSVNRATAALSRLSRQDALVLQCWLGRHHANEGALLDVVRRLEPGATRERAAEMLDEASVAYRLARNASAPVKAERAPGKRKAKGPRVRVFGGEGVEIE